MDTTLEGGLGPGAFRDETHFLEFVGLEFMVFQPISSQAQDNSWFKFHQHYSRACSEP